MGGGSLKKQCCKTSRTETEEEDLYDVEIWKKKNIIYHPSYNISFIGIENLHPFDSKKWGKVHRFLLEANVLTEAETIRPLVAKESDLLVVHTPEYLKKLKWSFHVARITEVPPAACVPNFLLQQHVLKPFRLQTGGTILAGKVAMKNGWAINIGGGFHHCHAEDGGGFCAYADITLCIKFMFRRLGVTKVMIVDLDAHQGNGHERDFIHDNRVYIMDVYNCCIYPRDSYAKHAIRKKVELMPKTRDKQYLSLVRTNLSDALKQFTPEVIVYNAGTDILENDPLGQLSITPDGIIKRDELVFRTARRSHIPIIMVTSGGYQQQTAKVIADSIINLHATGLLSTNMPQSKLSSPSL